MNIKINTVKIKWSCPDCGHYQETLEDLIEWNNRHTSVICSECGIELQQDECKTEILEVKRAKPIKNNKYKKYT